jgi:hypothetical protein
LGGELQEAKPAVRTGGSERPFRPWWRWDLIASAEEFVRLRTSDLKSEYDRAAHESAPLDVWLEVIRRFPALRRWVAHNKSVHTEVLWLLASDTEVVREVVARRRSCPPHLLCFLASDPDEGVRASVVYNAKAPLAALRLLADDPVPEISRQATSRLAALTTHRE